MSERYEDTTGSSLLVDSGTQGKVGGLDLWGNKIIQKREDTGQHVVEYGVVTLKGGEVLEISYSDYAILMLAIEQGKKGVITLSDTSIDTVMVGKLDKKRKLEDAPILLKPKAYDKHLKERLLAYFEAEVNLDGKGWKTQNITVENGKAIIEKLKTNEGDIRKRVKQLKPVYKMEYVLEKVDGRQVRVERSPEHFYKNIPLTRYNNEGMEVVMWYWAKNYDQKKNPQIGYKKVIELRYDEQLGDYKRGKLVDACSPDEVDYLDRAGR